MTGDRGPRRWPWLRWGLLLLGLWADYHSVWAASPKRVLILNSFGHEVAPFNAVASAFRTTLARELGEPVDIDVVSLDMARFIEPGMEVHLVEFLERRFAGRPLDLVVPFAGPAVKFVADHRDRLFSDSPVLFTAVDPRMMRPEYLRTNATLVTQNISLPGIIEDILQLQPETTNIVVVLGNSPLEKFWVSECRREFQMFSPRVAFTWLNELSLDQMREHVAVLPPRSFILYAMIIIDAAGVPYDNDEAFHILRAVATAPLFGYFNSQFGLGAIGGRLYQQTEIGVQGARTAIRILRGERPEQIPPPILKTANPVYDWRELRRWKIP